MTNPGGSAARPVSSRPHFTGRAAILAVVLCAIALSLAYPVREYIAQRGQIHQLLAQQAQINQQIRYLEQEKKKLTDPSYIEQQARDRLLMCFPRQTCYVIIDPASPGARAGLARPVLTPWYARLWSSVQQANGQHSPGAHPVRARRR